jgi:hypothetical protein
MGVWLNASEVELQGASLAGVRSVVVDRSTTRAALEWSDAGAEAVFADSAERRVDVTIVREGEVASGVFTTAPELGAMGALSFVASPNGSDANRVAVQATVVVLDVTHALARAGGARQTIRCVAISDDGSSEPVVESEVGA